jgi:WD40 repeat protein
MAFLYRLFFLWLTAISVSLSLVSLVAAEDDKEIDRLVKQLGSDKFREREAATKRLKAIGEPAVDTLVRAMKTNDPEVSGRVEAILTEIGEPALVAVTKAAASSDPEVCRRAEQLVAVLENKVYPELVLTGHKGEVWRVCVSADGKRVLTSSADKTLRLWDTHTGKQLRVFEDHTGSARSAALSQDGKRVLSGSDDGTVRLWDADTGKELLKMTGHTDGVYGVAFGPEGQALSCSKDRTMRLWDLNTGKNTGVFTGNTNPESEVAYSDKAKLAAAWGSYGKIHLWNLETGKKVRTITGAGATNVCFSPDGKRLLSAANDTFLTIRDVETGKSLTDIIAFQPPRICRPICVACSPDGKRLVSGGWHPDTTVRVWDATTGEQLRKYEGHTGYVPGVAFFPDGKRIASASADGTARIWRMPR